MFNIGNIIMWLCLITDPKAVINFATNNYAVQELIYMSMYKLHVYATHVRVLTTDREFHMIRTQLDRKG